MAAGLGDLALADPSGMDKPLRRKHHIDLGLNPRLTSRLVEIGQFQRNWIDATARCVVKNHQRANLTSRQIVGLVNNRSLVSCRRNDDFSRRCSRSLIPACLPIGQAGNGWRHIRNVGAGCNNINVDTGRPARRRMNYAQLKVAARRRRVIVGQDDCRNVRRESRSEYGVLLPASNTHIGIDQIG